MAIKAKDGGYEIEDAAGQRLATAKLKPNGDFVLKSPSGSEVLKVKVKNGGWKLYGPGGAERGKVSPKDGGFKIKNAADTAIARIKPKDAGAMKVYNAAGQEIAKISPKGDKVKAKDASDKPLFEIKGGVSVRGACFYALGRFTDLERAGLMIYFWKYAK